MDLVIFHMGRVEKYSKIFHEEMYKQCLNNIERDKNTGASFTICSGLTDEYVKKLTDTGYNAEKINSYKIN